MAAACWPQAKTGYPLELNQGAAAPCTPALGVGNVSMLEICPRRKYVHVGNMSMSEIWYAYALVGNMDIGNVAVENIVFGKKSRYHSEGCYLNER